MELKVEIEISISESTKAFITSLIGAPIRVASIPTEEIKPAITAVAAEEKPAEAKKPARKTKKEELVETPAEPEPETPAEPEKPEEKPAVDYDQYRKELRAFCSQRRVEGVNISGLVGQFLDKRGAKFSEIPDEKLEDFRKLVEAAEVQ